MIIAGCIGKRSLKIFSSVKRRRGKPKRMLDMYIILLAYGLNKHGMESAMRGLMAFSTSVEALIQKEL